MNGKNLELFGKFISTNGDVKIIKSKFLELVEEYYILSDVEKDNIKI